jgi:microsomal dipeptidase-like Zn-dependent dipeptidase
MLKKILKLFAVIIVLAAIAFFYFAPQIVDKAQNKTIARGITITQPPWYDSLSFIADLHCDALLWDRNLLKEHDYGHVDLPRLQKANVALQFFTIVSKTPKGINIEENTDKTDQIALLSFAQLRPVGTWFNLTERALNQCNDLHRFAKKSNGRLRVITSRQELNRFITDRQTNKKIVAGMLGIEGAHCLSNDINNLQKFYDAGVRYIGLAHFFDNEWAGSAHGLKKGGLTEGGKQLIKKMDSLHIIIDLAHSSPATVDDIFRLTSGPVIVSHTGVQGTCNNRRNLSDSQIAEIGRRNGLIGIGMWETAVCGTDAGATAKAIKYVADKIGVDKVALGSDFDGAIEAFFDITGFPLIVSALEKEGFNREEIEKIMGGNTRDFFLKNLPVR